LITIQAEVEKGKSKKDDGAAAYIEDSKQKEVAVEGIKERADYLDRLNNSLLQENGRWMMQLASQERERAYLKEQHNTFVEEQNDLVRKLSKKREEIKLLQQAIINKGGSFDLVSSLHLYCRLIHVVDLSEPCFGMNQMQKFIAAPNFSQLENSSTIQDTTFIEKYFIIIT
jgi:hypothetical protein